MAPATPDLRRFLREIVDAKRPPVADAGRADGPWYPAEVQVRGHVGIGKTPLTPPPAPTNGITIISARNGVGKTSAADGIRPTLSGAQARNYQLADHNLHCPDRSITVAVTNGKRNATIVCGPDETVSWQECGRAEDTIPASWIATFERYQPVRLYPESAPIVERPDNLHEFLKDSLELTVPENLLNEVDRIRKEGRDAARQLASSHERAVEGVGGLGGNELLTHMTAAGPTPSTGYADLLRRAAAGLPASAPVPPELVETWVVNDALASEVSATIAQLRAAQRDVVQAPSLSDRAREAPS